MDTNPYGEARNIEEIQVLAMDWARQTIALTISVRRAEMGEPLDYQQIENLASGEAHATAQKLWRAALEECGQPFEPGLVATLFARQVLDWAGDYRLRR
jgi:hypothetical protein